MGYSNPSHPEDHDEDEVCCSDVSCFSADVIVPRPTYMFPLLANLNDTR